VEHSTELFNPETLKFPRRHQRFIFFEKQLRHSNIPHNTNCLANNYSGHFNIDVKSNREIFGAHQPPRVHKIIWSIGLSQSDARSRSGRLCCVVGVIYVDQKKNRVKIVPSSFLPFFLLRSFVWMMKYATGGLRPLIRSLLICSLCTKLLLTDYRQFPVHFHTSLNGWFCCLSTLTLTQKYLLCFSYNSRGTKKSKASPQHTKLSVFINTLLIQT